MGWRNAGLAKTRGSACTRWEVLLLLLLVLLDKLGRVWREVTLLLSLLLIRGKLLLWKARLGLDG